MRLAIDTELRPLMAFLLFLCLTSNHLPAQTPPAADAGYFKYRKVMVPVRDGVKLETVILTPRNQQGALPILLTRTPYGVPREEGYAGYRPDPKSIEADGYIRVLQNIRGRFASEGEFDMNRPPRSLSDPKGVDETTDAWDTVDWLVKNVPNNNGRAGIAGLLTTAGPR